MLRLLPHEELETCTPMFLMIWEMQRLHPKHKAISFLVKGKIMEISKIIVGIFLMLPILVNA